MIAKVATKYWYTAKTISSEDSLKLESSMITFTCRNRMKNGKSKDFRIFIGELARRSDLLAGVKRIMAQQRATHHYDLEARTFTE